MDMLNVGNCHVGKLPFLHIGIINVKDFATISFSSTLHGLLAILWNIVLLTINHCEVEQF